jgi:hypothetical protein
MGYLRYRIHASPVEAVSLLIFELLEAVLRSPIRVSPVEGVSFVISKP